MAAKSVSTRSNRTKNIEDIKRRNTTARLQWAAIAAAIVLLIIAVFVFGWGTGDGVLDHTG